MQSSNTTLTIIRDYRQFLELKDKWNQLVARNYATGVWLRHEWYDCWWQAFGAGAQMFVLTMSDDGRLVAALPLMIVPMRIKGLRQRVLRFIANGITPRSNFIMPDISKGQMQAAWAEVFRHSSEWDLAILANLEQDSRGYTIWRDYLKAENIRNVELPERISPYIDLSEGWDAVFASFGKNLRRNLNRAKTRMSKESGFELIECTAAADVREALRHCYDISKVSWKGQQGVDMGGSGQRTRFYDLITEQAITNGWINIWLLKMGGKYVAFEYAFASGGYVLPVAADYDPEFRQFSPGTVLRSLELEQLCKRSMATYDFAGTVYDYKLFWTKKTRPHSQFWLFHSGFKSRLLYFVKAKLLPAFKRAPKPPVQAETETDGEE